MLEDQPCTPQPQSHTVLCNEGAEMEVRPPLRSLDAPQWRVTEVQFHVVHRIVDSTAPWRKQ